MSPRFTEPDRGGHVFPKNKQPDRCSLRLFISFDFHPDESFIQMVSRGTRHSVGTARSLAGLANTYDLISADRLFGMGGEGCRVSVRNDSWHSPTWEGWTSLCRMSRTLIRLLIEYPNCWGVSCFVRAAYWLASNVSTRACLCVSVHMKAAPHSVWNVEV